MAEERAFHIIKRRERNSMNRQTILFISDMRQVYLAEIMTKRGLNVRCLDIRNSGTVKEQLEKLKSFLAEADMLMIGGPSLNVYPAAGLIRYYQGHKLVLLNKSPVARDLAADLVITDPIGETLAQL